MNSSRESGTHGGKSSQSKRSSNVFASLGRNSDLMSASDLLLFVTTVLQTHRENRVDFVYVLQVTYMDTKWEIQKRFQDLHFFSERMAVASTKASFAEFPSKIVGKSNIDLATEKISELNVWLAEFLANTSFPPGSPLEQQVFNFIEVYLHQPPVRDRLSRQLPDRVLHMGYLRKLGGNKAGGAGNWKKRYMVLQQDLKYYEDEDTFRGGGLPKGVIRLNAFCVERRREALLHEFVVHAMPYPLVCRAASLEDLQDWLEALQQAGEGMGALSPGPRLGQQLLRQGGEGLRDSDAVQWAK